MFWRTAKNELPRNGEIYFVLVNWTTIQEKEKKNLMKTNAPERVKVFDAVVKEPKFQSPPPPSPFSIYEMPSNTDRVRKP